MLLHMSYGKTLQCWNVHCMLEIWEDDTENEEICERCNLILDFL
jgi:hypothetical protein